MNSRFNYLIPTGYFLLAGIFIPGFTAVTILGLQIIINKLGIECINSWNIVWTLSILGSIITPILFYRHTSKPNIDSRQKKNRLLLFNILELALLQSCITYLIADGYTLCYVADGQNGLQLGIAGWLALPFIFIISLIFTIIGRLKESRIKKSTT